MLYFHPTVRLIRKQLEVNLWSSHIELFPFREGTVVILDKLAYFWVMDEVVYAVNGHAKGWAPSCKWAPIGIDSISIEREQGGEG